MVLPSTSNAPISRSSDDWIRNRTLFVFVRIFTLAESREFASSVSEVTVRDSRLQKRTSPLLSRLAVINIRFALLLPLPATFQSRSLDGNIKVKSAVWEYLFSTRDSMVKCVCDFNACGETKVARQRAENRRRFGIIPGLRRYSTPPSLTG